LILVAFLGLAATTLPDRSQAQAAPAQAVRAQQDPAALSAAAEKYLRAQLASIPGVPTIAMDLPQVQNLAACAELFPFIPEPIHIRARMSVGVRCASPQIWTTFVQATVSIAGQYYVAAHQLGMGQILRADDLVARKADLVSLPANVVLDPSQAIGMKLASAMMTGQMLRTDNLRSALYVQRGQSVQLVVNGRGFRVSTEGKAMSSAGPGERIQVRTANGQVISGIVGRSGEVDVPL
jgi:flagella basal body P-ring formation protein FlgA